MELLIDGSPAVKALGSRFKLTESHLWDDGLSELRESFDYQEPLLKSTDRELDYEKGEPARANRFMSLLEDVKLAKEMNDLGLPLSFGSKKEKRNQVTSGKRKGSKKNNQQSPVEINNSFLESIKVSEEEGVSPAHFLKTSKFLDQSEILKHSIIADVDSLSISLERVGSVTSETSPYRDESVANCLCLDDESCLINAGADCDGKDLNGEIESAFLRTPSGIDLGTDGDDFNGRMCFDDETTGESTQDPPSEFTEMNNDEMLALNNSLPDLDLTEEYIESKGSKSQQLDEIAGNLSSPYSAKRKKKAKRTKPNRNISISSEGVLKEFTPIISKYWCQRYSLFSKFDHGIKMDEEGWFSVTPEVLAKHHADRCGDGTIIDFFTGVGGNAIQFAQRSKHVTTIDIDPNKIEFARYNAAIYGVEDNINFITADSFWLAPELKADTVFMSPPWGGPDYSKVKKFDINSMLKPRDGQFLFDVGRKIAPKIVMFLPRNVDINQLAELSLSATPPWSLEVELNFLNDRLKAVTAYFSEPSMS